MSARVTDCHCHWPLPLTPTQCLPHLARPRRPIQASSPDERRSWKRACPPRSTTSVRRRCRSSTTAGWCSSVDAADRDRAATALAAAARASRGGAVDVADEDWARRSQQDLAPVEVGRVDHRATLRPCRRPDLGGRSRHRVTRSSSSRRWASAPATTPARGCAPRSCSTSTWPARRCSTRAPGPASSRSSACALGARSVVAVDDDADAIESARENLALNGVPAGIELRVADFRSLPVQPLRRRHRQPHRRPADPRRRTCCGRPSPPADRLIISGVTLEEEADGDRARSPLDDRRRTAHRRRVDGARLAARSAARTRPRAHSSPTGRGRQLEAIPVVGRVETIARYRSPQCTAAR